jgi:uncharacterized protein with von Willebrand factor type A (vWA) domain
VDRHEQDEIFDQAFQIFWRDPELLKRAMATLLPTVTAQTAEDKSRALKRVADALKPLQPDDLPPPPPPPPPGQETEIDARLVWSDEERLQTKDFEQMSAAELAVARRAIEQINLERWRLPTRRLWPKARGRTIDMRATMRRQARGDSILKLARRDRVERNPPLVVLCDISGSMSGYSRLLLHFLHSLTNACDRVHSFVFGTRLTNITRALRHRDVDEALERCGQSVEDWAGGTRIGATLSAFNRDWSRRVLGQGAIVLLITDGLDRGGEAAAGEFDAAIERLHLSCRRLVWLNPLLRFDRYAPHAQGARILIKHVDELRTVHNLQSLGELAAALGDQRHGTQTHHAASRWRSQPPGESKFI